MPEARVYQCPVCGAFAREGERACRHCGSAIATVRCAHCFELSSPSDLHCRGCGLELGLSPAPEDAGQGCPDCKLPLHAFEAGAGRLLACEGCGGQMVTHGLLRALVQQREALGRAALSLVGVPRGNPLHDRVRYRPCPGCGSFMNRKNFGGTSGIVVDVCSIHGTFFEAGELPRVLAFVQRGGLAKAQNTPASPRPASSSAAAPLLAESSTSPLDDLVDFVRHVLRTLRD